MGGGGGIATSTTSGARPKVYSSAHRQHPGGDPLVQRVDLSLVPSLAALLVKDRLCRPGLDDPDVSPALVALWCSCRARVAGRLPTVRKPEGGDP
jgi:hypothetical protein